MKAILSTFLFLFLFNINSKAQHVQWAYPIESVELTEAVASSLDENNNLIVTGYYQEELWLSDDFQLNSAGENDIFIAKYNSDGEVYWARTYGGNGYETPKSIEQDSDENIFYLADFSDTTDVDGTVLISLGLTDAYLAKLDSDGNPLWTVQFGTSSYDYAADVALDTSGNSYVAGSFTGTLTIGDETLVSGGQSDSFLCKIDSSGDVVWAKRFGNYYNEHSEGLCLDESGRIYISGDFQQSTTFGGVNYSSAGLTDGFIACYDNDGNEIWFNEIGGSSYDSSGDIEMSSDGNLIVCGGFSYSANIDELSTGDGLNSGNMFVLKCNLDGEALWLNAIYGSASGRAITSDMAGNVYAGSFFSGTVNANGTVLATGSAYQICLTKYDSDGNQLWARQEGGSGYALIADLAGSNPDEYFLVGYFSGTLDFGNVALTASLLNGTDAFVGKFSATPLGVENPESSKSTGIYPNPSSGFIQILGPSVSKIEIHNVLGELVYSEAIPAEKSAIDLSGLHSGTYLITIQLENGSIENHRLIVE